MNDFQVARMMRATFLFPGIRWNSLTRTCETPSFKGKALQSDLQHVGNHGQPDACR